MVDYYRRESVTVGTVDPYHAASLEAQGFVKVDAAEAAPEGAPAKAKRPSRAKGAKAEAAPEGAPATEAAPEGESPEDDDLIGDPAPEADGDDEAL